MHVARPAFRPLLAVDPRRHAMRTGFEFVGRHQAGTKDLAGVEVFALGGSETHHDLFGLAVARPDIVEDGVPRDVLRPLWFWYIPGGAAADDAQLHLTLDMPS